MMKLKVKLLAALALLLAAAAPAHAQRYPLTVNPTNFNFEQLPANIPLQLRAPTTSSSTIILPHGTAPTGGALVNGACWTTTAGLFCYINGVTQGPFGSAAGTVTSVGLTVPGSSIFGVSGSPVTSSGNLGLTTTGTSGGIPYFSSTSVLSSSALLTLNGLLIGGGAGGAPASIAVCLNGQLPVGATGSPPACQTMGGDVSAITSGGSVTLGKVNGVSFPSSGTSGGIPYYSSSSAVSSSGVLSANNPVIGGGAGSAPSSGSRSGNTTTFATTSGSLPSGHCPQFDASGNIIDFGAPCGSAATDNFSRAVVTMANFGGL